jgi:hypothetical protein
MTKNKVIKDKLAKEQVYLKEIQKEIDNPNKKQGWWKPYINSIIKEKGLDFVINIVKQQSDDIYINRKGQLLYYNKDKIKQNDTNTTNTTIMQALELLHSLINKNEECTNLKLKKLQRQIDKINDNNYLNDNGDEYDEYEYELALQHFLDGEKVEKQLNKPAF